MSGDAFRAEIHEQPDALRRLLEHRDEFAAAADAVRRRRARTIRLVGHGSSDAAASFGVYAFGLLPAWTAFRDSISLSTYYDASVDVSDSTVVGLSQSGQTPDVVSYVVRARERGALTLAITNDPGSDLAAAAEWTLPLAAGDERSVAASKTLLNQFASLLLLAAAAAGRDDEMAGHIVRVAAILEAALPDLEEAVAPVAAAFAEIRRMYVIGRGIELGTAREIALKLTETCRIGAEALTSTDFAHGPIAAVGSFPVWTIASRDESLPALVAAARLARDAGARLVACGSAASEVPSAEFRLRVPDPPIALASPLLSVVPGQLFAAALAQAKGLDADRPLGLTKVTLAP